MSSTAGIVTVFGATGIQGGSVTEALLRSNVYSVKAITRNASSNAAKSLVERGVDVVEADLNDPASLRDAIAGSSAVYGVTNFFETFATEGAEKAIEVEVAQGIALAKAAESTPSLKHFIWSTLPPTEKITHGKMAIPHYEAKSRVQEFIESQSELLKKTTFLWIPWYGSNILYPFYQPIPIPTAGPDTFVQILGSPASTMIKVSGDTRTNTGLFVEAILAQPEKTLPGRMVIAETEEISAGDLLKLWGTVHGKQTHYCQVDKEVYYGLWPHWGKLMDDSHVLWDNFEQELQLYEKGVLNKDDLNISGLVGIAAAWAKMEI